MSERPFVKTGPAEALAMFEAEADGLCELASTNTLRVPKVFDVGVTAGQAYIKMERLVFERGTRATDRLLGERLAAVHRCNAKQHGWHRDNTIGLTPQQNVPHEDWTEFFRERRLRFQLTLAEQNGYDGELQVLGRRLLAVLDDLLAGHEPVASLLHGDLWSGNYAVADGEPVVFDPAVYYGDRETDLAMTRLFGGFSDAFYQAYANAWPLTPGHERRNDLYQLYHVLNHLNLFGSGYLGQSTVLMRNLLAAV